MRAAVYHPISLALLSLDLALVAPTALQFARQWRSLHIVVFAGGLGTLLADAAMVANFWPRELYFVLNDFDLDVGSPWCKASAVWTIASLFSLGVSSVVTAVVTRRSVSFGPQRFVTRKWVAMRVAAGWLLGLGVALAYLASDRIGTPSGVYCCVRDYSDPVNTLPLAMLTVSCGLAMSWTYAGLVRDLREAVVDMQATPPKPRPAKPLAAFEERAASPSAPASIDAAAQEGGAALKLSVAEEPPCANASHTTLPPPSPTASRYAASAPELRRSLSRVAMHPYVVAVRERTRTIVLVFYLCWLPVTLYALSSLAGLSASFALDAVCAWFLKLQPAIDCVLLRQLLRRAAAAAAASSGGAGALAGARKGSP
jgi:hypothetical protein